MKKPMLSVLNVSSTGEPDRRVATQRARSGIGTPCATSAATSRFNIIAIVMVTPSVTPCSVPLYSQPGETAGDRAPHQPVEQRRRRFLAEQPARVRRR